MMNRIAAIIGASVLAGVVSSFAQPEPPKGPQAPFRMVMPFAPEGGASSFLGVGVAEVDTERAKELKLKEERGVEVKNVEEGSPAAKAGVKVNDVVLEFNGQRVEGAEQFVRLVRETPVSRQVKLLIARNGSTQTLTAAVGARTAGVFFSQEFGNFERDMKKLNSQMPDMPKPNMSMRSRLLGVESESLGPQLAEYFGVKEGVLVRSVVFGSAAEKAGLKAGDVITRIGDRKVNSPGDISGALRAVSGKSLPVTITRSRKEIVVNVSLDERSGTPVNSRVGVTL